MPVIDTKKYALPITEYVPVASIVPKRICSHFTAGPSAYSAYQSWLNDRDAQGNRVRVATPFIIDKDGAIYQTFDPAHGWAWHIGGIEITPTATNTYSLGIEVACWGPLTLQGDTLYNYLKRPVCTLAETDKYVKLPAVWRTFQYFEAYTPAQKISLKTLVHQLAAQFKIPLALLPKELRMEVCPRVAELFNGIICHHNFVGYKTDSGPLVDLEWLIAA